MKKIVRAVFFLVGVFSVGCVSDAGRLFQADSGVYQPPTAHDMTLVVPVNQITTIQPSWRAKGADKVILVVCAHPFHGTAAVSRQGEIPSIVYTPEKGFTGYDTVLFAVHDGVMKSNPARITIHVGERLSVNDRLVSVNEDNPTDFIMPLENPENLDVTWHIETGPSHGSLLHLTGQRWRFTPEKDFSGKESVRFHVSSSAAGETGSATVTFLIGSDNDAPVAETMSLTVDEDRAVPVMLFARDADNDPLSFAISRYPLNGALVPGTRPGEYIYHPGEHFFGTDSFSWYASDGCADSATAAVIIEVRPVYDAPVALDAGLVAFRDTPIDFHFPVANPDNSRLTWTVGTVSEGRFEQREGSAWRFIPQEDFTGSLSLDYHVTDEQGAASSARLRIQVLEPGVIFVKADAPPGGDGLTWERAINRLDAACSRAVSSSQIWIASGEYRQQGDAELPLCRCVSGVALRGGFSGTEYRLSERTGGPEKTVINGNGEKNHVIIMNGGTIDNLTITGGNARGTGDDRYGGGVLILSGTVTMTQTSVTRNAADGGGGGIALRGKSVLLLTACELTGNNAEDGGAIHIGGESSLTIEGCMARDNSASGHGGALEIASETPSLILGGFFSGNRARFGGALSDSYGEVRVSSSVFRDNRASMDGGAVYSVNLTPAETVFEASEFTGNHAQGEGGAIYARRVGRLTVGSGTIFRENSAMSGGALFSRSPLMLTSVILSVNRSDQSGGALCSDGMVIMQDALFEKNFCEGSGGAVFLRGGAVAGRISFHENSASVNGGAVKLATWGEFTIGNSNFHGNRALLNGGAAFCEGTVNCNEVLCSECTAHEGGAIYSLERLSVAGGVFIRNSSDKRGGAIHAGTYLDLFNVLFHGNQSPDTEEGSGGAVFSTAHLRVRQGTFALNHAGSHGYDIMQDGGSATIENSLFYDSRNVPTGIRLCGIEPGAVRFSLIRDNLYVPGFQNLNADPRFESELRYDFRIREIGSPAVDHGDIQGLNADERAALSGKTVLSNGIPDTSSPDCGYHYSLPD